MVNPQPPPPFQKKPKEKFGGRGRGVWRVGEGGFGRGGDLFFTWVLLVHKFSRGVCVCACGPCQTCTYTNQVMNTSCSATQTVPNADLWQFKKDDKKRNTE